MKTGDMLGNYRIDRLLGEGGMGAVYQAFDLSLQREVAVKLIHPHLARRPDFRDRFVQEARLIARLDHPGIVKVYTLGKEGDLLFLPMELIKGGNLRQLLDELLRQRKWIPLSEAVLLVQQLCQIVEYAHQKGVLHRDIKPANLMLKPEPTGGLPFRVALTDLGLAKLLEGLGITQEGTSMGTPAYMSPEQASGQPTDPRSDVYSLGILLYELAVGRLPFLIRSLTEATHYHIQVPPPAPRSIRKDLPESLEQIILKALEKAPDSRYASAKELEDALAAANIQSAAEVASASTELVESDRAQESSLITEYEKSIVVDPQIGEASLATIFDSGSIGPRSLSLFGDLSILPGAESLIQVVHKDTSSRTIPLPHGTVTIGRDNDNQIVLEDAKASRRHAQITWDGTDYRVMDLNSSNGTFLDNARLLPGISELWRRDHVLRIGDSSLRIIPASVDSHTRLAGASSLSSTKTFHISAGAGLVAVAVDPQHLEVQAGGSATAQFSLLNQGPIVDHFSFSLKGIPGNWIHSLPAAAQMMPNERKETAFTLQVPRTPESTAGDHRMTLKVTSENDASQFVEIELLLSVAAYSQFESEMQPQRLHAGQISNLSISNEGNQSEKFLVQLKDPANELSFQPSQLEIQVAAGDSAAKSFKPQLRQTRWIGGQKTHPFTASISLPKGERQILQGDVLSRGLIPAWLPPVMLLLCLLLVFGTSRLMAPILFPPPTSTTTATLTLTPSPTLERGVPIVQEWCVYRSDGPVPTSFTDCDVQVAAEVGEQLIIQWRVSNADEVIIEPFGNRPLSGEMRVTATEGMAAFGLKASNASGKTIQKSVQINVILPSSTPLPPTAVPATPVPPTRVPPSPVPPTMNVPPSVTPIPTATPFKSILRHGEFLRHGESLTSSNGQYTLICQDDGNFVLYRVAGGVLWASNTPGNAMEICIMQDDGNLVVYGPNSVIWASNTSAPETWLELQNDGNLVIYQPGHIVVWSSQTEQP